MTALSRVTLASAGLSCFCLLDTTDSELRKIANRASCGEKLCIVGGCKDWQPSATRYVLCRVYNALFVLIQSVTDGRTDRHLCYSK